MVPNCAPENLEIPGSTLPCRPGMTGYDYFLTPNIGISLSTTYTDPSAVRCA
jgi:hypothetical protein